MSVKRRTILTTAAALPAVSLLAGAPRASAATGRTYYVAQDGNDQAAGTSEGAPWKSINRVNEAFAKGQVVRGDSVLFKRGQSFYGEFSNLGSFGDSGENLTLGSYGSGDLPKILGYKVLNKPQAWKSAGNGLWQIDLFDTNNYSGNTSSVAGKRWNVGQLWVNGKLYPVKKDSPSELKSDWEFCSEGGKGSAKLTVRAPQNPAEAGEVLVAVDGNLVDVAWSKNITIQELHLMGIGGHGVSMGEKASGITIKNNRISWIGGSYTPNGSLRYIRYGNGIQAWIGSKDVLAEGNTIEEVFDVAATMQGDQWGEHFGWQNVHYKNNHIARCSQSFEAWSAGKNRGAGTGFQNCSFTGNKCADAGVGWGQAVRVNPDEGGVHLLTYDTQLPMDLKITGNNFVGAVNAYMYRFEGANALHKAIIDGNTIQLKAGQKLQQQRSETIEQHDAWSSATGFDKNSQFTIG